MSTRNEVVFKRLLPLEGGTITKVFFIECDWADGDFPALEITYSNGDVRTLVIQQDAEGNGPGFIDVWENS